MSSHKLQSIRDSLLFYGDIFNAKSIALLLRSKTDSVYYADMMNIISKFLYPVTNKNDVIDKILPHIKVIEKDDFGDVSDNFVKNFVESCSSLEKLHLSDEFNHRLNLPLSLKTVIFGRHYSEPTNLPSGIKSVKFGGFYDQSTKLPEGIEEVTFGYKYNQPTDLPEGIKSVTFNDRYNQPITLPTSIKSVIFGIDYNQPTNLPKGIESVKFGKDYEQPTKLPEGIKFVHFSVYYNHHTIIPSSVIKLSYWLDDGSKTIILDKKYDDIPKTIL